MKRKGYLIACLLLIQQSLLPLAIAANYRPMQGPEKTVSRDDKTGNVKETTTDAQGGKTTETWTRDAKGGVTHTTENPDGSKTTEKTAPPSGKTETTQEMDNTKTPPEPMKTPDGLPVGTDTTTKPDGSYETKTRDKDGNETTTTGRKDASGKEWKKQTKVEKKRNGKPKYKKTETEFDENGNPKHVTESSKNSESSSWHVDKEKTEEPKRPDHDKKDDKKDEPKDDKNYFYSYGDSQTLSGVVIAAPETVEQGSPFTCMVATATGAVVANQDVRISDGVNGNATVRTDDNGRATFSVPNGWNAVRIEVMGAAVCALASKAMSHGGSPVVNQVPSQITPGEIVSIKGQNLGSDATAMVGGQPMTVLAASPNAMTVAAPKNMQPGPCAVVVSNADGASAPKSTEAIKLQWDAGAVTILQGHTIARTLTIVGSQDKVMLNVTHPEGDAAQAKGTGWVQSSGGPNNIIRVQLTGVRAGGYSLMATMPGAMDRSAMSDRNGAVSLMNATDYAAAMPEEAGCMPQDLQAASGIARSAAQTWSKASSANRAGQMIKGRMLELAAQMRDRAASEKAFGNSGTASSLQRKASAAEAQAK